MIDLTIVVLAYNRPKSLARLLRSLGCAKYRSQPKLIISLEGQASASVKKVAYDFRSDSLAIEVIERPRRLGLRNHVLQCGNLAAIYGAVLLLEDDIIVDPFFYHYAEEALRFYRASPKVAGIALYAQEYNEFANRPFRPMPNGYSTYLMQVPCSWGQCWSADQWSKFMLWYESKSCTSLGGIESLPPSVKKWPESSWKKYFHAYMCENDKYFVYPFSSYTSNCSDDGGTHNYSGSNLAQVLLSSPKRSAPLFQFCPDDYDEVIYDSFMEATGDFVYREIGMSKNECEIDIYGTKPVSMISAKRYALTSKYVTEKIKSFSYDFRPHEFNIIGGNEAGNAGSIRLAVTKNIVDRKRLSDRFIAKNYYMQMKSGEFEDICFSIYNLLFRTLRALSRKSTQIMLYLRPSSN